MDPGIKEDGGGGGVKPHLPNFSVVNAGHLSTEGENIVGGPGTCFPGKF